MKSTQKQIISLALGLGLALATLPLFADVAPTAVPAANANKTWKQSHPARAKDNARIRNQRKQLKADLASGKISKDQYNAQMKEVNTVHKEEKVDAAANQNGGHLTSGQQQAIKQQLNENHQDIKQDVQGGQPH